MKSMQYTIRSVPPNVDKALRDQARKAGKSLNEVALEALAKGAGVSGRPVVHHDLDWMFGTAKPDPQYDKAMEWLDSAPKEIT